MRDEPLVGLVEVVRHREDYSTTPVPGLATKVRHRRAMFKPYVPDEARLPELTFRAVALGSLLGLVFGASSVYLALRVGPHRLRLGADRRPLHHDLPRLLALPRAAGPPSSRTPSCRPRARRGSRSRPAWPSRCPRSSCSASRWTGRARCSSSLCGGILGVLMMIPLRRYLIVKEHGVLTYPEGTAAAEVLVAGEERRRPRPSSSSRACSSASAPSS